MKSIIVADIHLSLYSQDSIVAGVSRRLHYLKETLIQIAEYAKVNDIKYFTIAGDTLHNKSIIHAIAQSVLLDFLRSYPDITFIIIDGNHDMSSKSGDGVSGLKGLDNEPNVIMLHESKDIENISFVPWNPKKMKDDIKKAPKGNYLVSHFGLNEAMLNSGISIVSDIGLNDLKHFKHCFIGHYHLPQEVANVTIPGSIIQLDWGEKGEEKRFIVLDSDTGNIDSIKITGYQKHIELELNSENAKEVIKQAKLLRDNGDFVKLLKVDNVDTTTIEKSFNIVDKTTRDITNRGIDSSMSLEDKLKAYLTIKEIPLDKHDDYIKEAKSIIDRIV
jgi:DNA repair exonuclease SbcCD nuclease subunit